MLFFLVSKAVYICTQEGETVIGSEDYSPTPDIVLSGAGVLPLHCRVTLSGGTATIHPCAGAQCWLNTVLIDKPAKLSQGMYFVLTEYCRCTVG